MMKHRRMMKMKEVMENTRSEKYLSTAKMLELILKMKSSNKSRTKESEVKLSNVPEPSLFQDWITKARASLASATGRGDKGLQWVMEAENTEATMDSLSRSGNKYLSFDAKLAAECLRITHGDLQRDIKAESDRMAKEGKMLRGRQMLWMIHQWYRIASSAGQLYDLADLTKVTCLRGKSRLTLSSFLYNWNRILDGMKTQPNEETKLIIFAPNIKQYTDEIKHDIDIFDRAKDSDPQKSYQFLYDAAKAYIMRIREESNRAAIQKKLSGSEYASLSSLCF